MKRGSDMDLDAPMKRSRRTDGTEMRLLIQSKSAGSIIGKGGKNITRLRNDYEASISVPDCPGPERILNISGSDDVVVKVLEEVLMCLDESPHKNNDCDIRLLLHQSQAGCVIGKGGSRVKELKEMCEGQVKVYSAVCPQSTDRVVQIVSSKDRALQVVETILESLKESPPKGNQNQYDPRNFNEFYPQDYGGWSDGPKGGRFPPMGRGPPMGGPPPMSRGPMGGPPGPPFGRRGPSFNRGDDYDGGMRHGKSFMNGSNRGDMATTTQVTIPKEAAGAIIGKGGSRIHKIRMDSGASISIEDSRPGSNDRIITISGTDTQIKHAQYLLQQSVREYGGPALSGGGGGGRRY